MDNMKTYGGGEERYVTVEPKEYCVLVELVSERRGRYSGTFDFHAYPTFEEAYSLQHSIRQEHKNRCYTIILAHDDHRSLTEWRNFFVDYFKAHEGYGKMRHEHIIKKEWL